MTEVQSNPFVPVEVWHNTEFTLREDGDNRDVEAKHYHVRFVVGESHERRFVDRGRAALEEVHGSVLCVAPSIHLVPGEAHHYDHTQIENIVGNEGLTRTRSLKRAGQCDQPQMIEVAYVSPFVECCSLSEDQARQSEIPVKYVAGYLIDRSDGVIRVALHRSVLESGEVYYDNIHIIPESAVLNWSCLDIGKQFPSASALRGRTGTLLL